jgi:hypothetical protein
VVLSTEAEIEKLLAALNPGPEIRRRRARRSSKLPRCIYRAYALACDRTCRCSGLPRARRTLSISSVFD